MMTMKETHFMMDDLVSLWRMKRLRLQKRSRVVISSLLIFTLLRNTDRLQHGFILCSGSIPIASDLQSVQADLALPHCTRDC